MKLWKKVGFNFFPRETSTTDKELIKHLSFLPLAFNVCSHLQSIVTKRKRKWKHGSLSRAQWGRRGTGLSEMRLDPGGCLGSLGIGLGLPQAWLRVKLFAKTTTLLKM